MKMQRTLLFPNVGRRVELVSRFKEYAKNNDIQLNIIGTDLNNDAPALYFCDKIYQLPKQRDEKLVELFNDIIRTNNVDTVICTIDPDLEFFSENRHIFNKNKKLDLMLSHQDIIRASSDKNLTEQLFRDAKINTPQVLVTSDIFPLFAKPAKGSGSFGAKLIQNKEELETYQQEYGLYNPIYQQYISGKEYTIDCFVTKNNEIYISPRERVKVRGGEVTVSKTVKHHLLIQESKKLLNNSKFYGPITLQAIVSDEDNKAYFIEVNPRFGGGSILSIEAGLNSISYILDETNSVSNIKENIKMLRYDMSVFIDENE
ncbi:ATP-grasp domain-containing protein [Providencia manganoxydans]|uniref:ATP-grasp domain-containing protein n=1 Tax=Providencia manganoxydans TaxID=2923283 RepID=UPI0034E3A6E8